MPLSPMPLLASFEYESAVQADSLSKSTMRLVAHEVVNNSNIADILHWPSFEIFRWAGSQSSSYFAADDGAAWHVSEEKVAGTIKAFVECSRLRPIGLSSRKGRDDTRYPRPPRVTSVGQLRTLWLCTSEMLQKRTSCCRSAEASPSSFFKRLSPHDDRVRKGHPEQSPE